MVIDYSKWDKLDLSDEEDEGKNGPKISVKKIGQNESVTINSQGYHLTTPANTTTNSSTTNTTTTTTNGSCGVEEPLLTTKGQSVEQVGSYNKYFRNGTVTPGSHFFNQDRYHVNFYLRLPFPFKRLDVRISRNGLKIHSCGELRLEKQFYGTVNEDEMHWNWEVITMAIDWPKLYQSYLSNKNSTTNKGTTNGNGTTTTSNSTTTSSSNNSYQQLEAVGSVSSEENRFIVVNLEKKNEVPNCTLWWPKLFKDDVEEIRLVDNSEFVKNWNEAHAAFRERVRNSPKISI